MQNICPTNIRFSIESPTRPDRNKRGILSWIVNAAGDALIADARSKRSKCQQFRKNHFFLRILGESICVPTDIQITHA